MKKRRVLAFFTAAAFSFGGCSSDDRQQPYMMGEKPAEKSGINTASTAKVDSTVTVAEIEAETQKEIARINKTRDLELRKMQEETKLAEMRNRNDLALKEHNLSSFEKEGDYELKKSSLSLIAFALAALFALVFYIFRKVREDKLTMHRDQMEKEIYLREKELQVKMAEKILDTIASGKLSDEEEKHLLETLDKATPTITYRKQ